MSLNILFTEPQKNVDIILLNNKKKNLLLYLTSRLKNFLSYLLIEIHNRLKEKNPLNPSRCVETPPTHKQPQSHDSCKNLCRTR